eukprot:11898072-Prorocentrum_lima.AAC.1
MIASSKKERESPLVLPMWWNQVQCWKALSLQTSDHCATKLQVQCQEAEQGRGKRRRVSSLNTDFDYSFLGQPQCCTR